MSFDRFGRSLSLQLFHLPSGYMTEGGQGGSEGTGYGRLKTEDAKFFDFFFSNTSF